MINQITVSFDGKKYVVKECLAPLFLLEKHYGSLQDVPETLEAQFRYFYYMLKGSNKDFNYSFDRFMELIPYQMELIDQLSKLTVAEKKKRKKKWWSVLFKRSGA